MHDRYAPADVQQADVISPTYFDPGAANAVCHAPFQLMFAETVQNCIVYRCLWKSIPLFAPNKPFFLGDFMLLDSDSGRSGLIRPKHRWFVNCLVMVFVLFIFHSPAACCVCDRTGSIRPSLFSNLGTACPESSPNHFRFVVLKWVFIQPGAGVIPNTCAQT